MQRWKLSIGLAALTLVGAALAPRLFPSGEDVPQVEPPDEPVVVAELPTPIEPVRSEPRHIDVVLAIDTSGSMDALLDSARARLWDIVNEIDRQDADAELRVGLLAFGTPSYGESSGFVKVLQPLTDDLDAVYTAAFGLTTNGGDEYVGSTIDTALALDWINSGNPDDRRLLFIAGNEGAMQGPVSPIDLARRAQSRRVLVSTLFAGSEASGIQQGWGEVSAAGGGRYLHIDATDSARGIAATPYDQQIQALNSEINSTYVAYGREGERKLGELQKNDARARSMGSGALTSRIAAKGGKKFKTASWDLVSAADQGVVGLETVEASALPAELKDMDKAALAEHIDTLAEKRRSAKAKLQNLQKQRASYLDTQQPDSVGLDAQMTEALGDLL